MPTSGVPESVCLDFDLKVRHLFLFFTQYYFIFAQFTNLNFFQSPTTTPANVSECSPPSPTCLLISYPEMTLDGRSINRVRVPIGTNAHGAGFETRVTLLDTVVTLNYSADPIYIHSRLVLRNYVANTWHGNILSASNIGQGGYCEETCDVQQYSPDGDAFLGDTYTVKVEILPILYPCDGCSISCTGDFSLATNGVTGCTANPTGSNCITVTVNPVTSDLSGSCTAGGGANKIRVHLTTSTGLKCNENCSEQFLLDDNYLLGVRNPGLARDEWLSTGSTVTIALDADLVSPISFTLEIMSVYDQFPAI